LDKIIDIEELCDIIKRKIDAFLNEELKKKIKDHFTIKFNLL